MRRERGKNNSVPFWETLWWQTHVLSGGTHLSHFQKSSTASTISSCWVMGNHDSNHIDCALHSFMLGCIYWKANFSLTRGPKHVWEVFPSLYLKAKLNLPDRNNGTEEDSSWMNQIIGDLHSRIQNAFSDQHSQLRQYLGPVTWK